MVEKSVAVAVWAPGPDRAGVFPAGHCECHLPGEAASQQEDSKASERGSSTRIVWRQGKMAIYSKGRS